MKPWGSAKCPTAAGNSGCPVIELLSHSSHCCSFVHLPVDSSLCLFDAPLLHDAVLTLSVLLVNLDMEWRCAWIADSEWWGALSTDR